MSKKKRKERLEAQARAKRMKQIRTIGFVVLGIVVLAGFAIWRNASIAELANIDAPPNLQGDSDAVVKLVEYGDFGCHACRAWHNSGAKARLQEEFGEQISFEFRHLPVITAQSPKAAEAAQCAAEQDAFWAYHDHIYENTPEGALSVTQLKQYATDINLEASAFEDCLDSDKYRYFIEQQQREAQRAGARGTPFFMIDGQPVAMTYPSMSATIRQIIESES